jgi:hypothetical protein
MHDGDQPPEHRISAQNGGYRMIAADQPQSLSVMETLGRRVPYRRLFTI